MAKKTAKKASKKSDDQLHFAPLVVLALAIGITIGVLFWGYTRPDTTEVLEDNTIYHQESP